MLCAFAFTLVKIGLLQTECDIKIDNNKSQSVDKPIYNGFENNCHLFNLNTLFY